MIKLAGKTSSDKLWLLVLGNKSINCLISTLLNGHQKPAIVDKNITVKTIVLCSFRKYHMNGKSIFGSSFFIMINLFNFIFLDLIIYKN